jgi:hypothetical protein
MKPIEVPPVITRQLDPERDPAQCAWWLKCPNAATGTLEHSQYGPVPICDSCRSRVVTNEF